ncbi:unnamed protein product [Macrosiphum euphorbiae]|uniref:DDE-1 domain-containing protein n=1 Tax=Macrosiphum euphorbiae TaxID=13131 RepID=A0AAV0Y127_9HEMI|nr:unnamed protein product [Macrosiphum euphorbiae]
MPRVYISDPRGKQYRKRNEDDLNAAATEVKNGISLRKAAENYNVHYSTLQRWVKANGKRRTIGGQTVLDADMENMIVERLVKCAEWGYPMDTMDLRMIVKHICDKKGIVIKRFKDNMPGHEFALSFLKRHAKSITPRICQNIKRARAAVSPEQIDNYFNKLEVSIEGIPSSNIINYDETNLSDDPGRSKVIAKKGMKYPERIMNSTKSATSIMFAVSGDGVVLPTYVVYKSTYLYGPWRNGAPKGTRFNCSKSGWFDTKCFEDWVFTVAIPYLKKLDGPKVLIGDNLSSHLSCDAINMCAEIGAKFVFLPANSTHLTQPLDVAFFRPLKQTWRTILKEWKKGPGRKEPSVPKSIFPTLLNKLITALEPNRRSNIISGFEKCGIIPLNRNKVLSMIPNANTPESSIVDSFVVEDSVLNILKDLRYETPPKTRSKRTRLNVEPGKSVGVSSSESENGDDEEHVDKPDFLLTNIDAPDIMNVDEMNTDTQDNTDPDDEINSPDTQDNIDPDEINSPDSNDQTIPVTIAPNVKYVEINNSIKIVQNIYDIDISDINVGDWLLVQYHSDMYICKVSKIGVIEFEGEFLRKKPSLKKDSDFMLFVYPQVPDLYEFMYDQIIGKLDPPAIKRGIHKFNVIF